MPLLSRLGISSLTPPVLEFFDVHKIRTLEDFLVCDVYSLPGLTGAVHGAEERMQAVTDLLNFISTKHAGNWKTGGELVLSLDSTTFLPTGCDSLDELLGGGLREGTVTELVGSSATGKTQVCLQAAAWASLTCHAGVAFIDTATSFSARRVVHMMGAFAGSKARLQEMQEAQRSDMGRAMKMIVRMRAFDMASVLALLQDISKLRQAALEKPKAAAGFFGQLRLLVLDSASAIVAPILGGSHSQGHALMMSLSRMLKHLAAHHKLAVLITNHTVAGEAGQPKPALGESWKTTAHVRVLLQRDYAADVFTASLLKHSSKDCNQGVTFKVGREGVQAYTRVEEPDSD